MFSLLATAEVIASATPLSEKSVPPRFAAPIFIAVSVPDSVTCASAVSRTILFTTVSPVNFESSKIQLPLSPCIMYLGYSKGTPINP